MFRLLSAYALIFSLSLILMLGYIALTVTRDMERETDLVMRWEFTYFNSIDDSGLPAAIAKRMEREQMNPNFYGLFTADGRYEAGDILAVPAGLSLQRVGLTCKHTLAIKGSSFAPVTRAMAEQRPNGEILVVAQDLTHILRIREAIIQALIGGALFFLMAGVITGVLVGMRQMRRVRMIRRVTLQIAQGDLQKRLPVGGRDEIDMLAHLVNHMLDEVERLMTEVKGACDGIAHDLRTPLGHVRTLLARIAERAKAFDDEPLSLMLDRARSDTDLLLERFRAMLRISEIGALQRRGGFAELQLETLVAEIGELYEPLAERKSIDFLVSAAVVAPVYGDRALLFEMLSNLIDNALKFTPPNGAVSIELTQTPKGPVIDIIDNGPGIPSSERDAVLQLFYRSEQTRHIQGSGLGLSVVSAVLRVHDFSMVIGNAESGTHVRVACWTQTLA